MLELAANWQLKLHCIANLFEALHGNGIRYCHLKGNPKHLEISLSGDSDMDILFDPKQKAKLESVLTSLGFKEFKAIAPKQLKDVVDFIALDEGSGKVIHLHTYYALTIGEPYLKGYQVGMPDDILARRVFNEEFGTYCIAPAFELIFLYLTEILKLRHRDYLGIYLKNRIQLSEKAIRQYNWLKKHTTCVEVEAAIKTIFDNYAPVIDLIKADLSSTQLRKLAPLIRKESVRYRLYSPAAALALRWKRELTTRLRRKLSRILRWPVLSTRINPRGGIVVAFLGREAAGKPKALRLLSEAFGKKLDVYEVSFHPENNAAERKHKGIFHIITSFTLAWKTYLNLKRAESARKRGALVICHRFPQSLIIGSKSESTSFRIARKYAPDLVFKFITGRETPGTVDAQTVRPDAHAFPGRLRIVTVDADRPLNEVVTILKKEIWRIL